MRGDMNCVIAVTAILFCIFSSAVVVPSAQASSAQKRAKTILASTNTAGGLVVHLGCRNGRLTAALRRNDRYVVQGLDRDPEDVKKARRYLRLQGLYGDVSVRHWEGERLPYADNLVNLLVSGEEGLEGVSSEEIMRVLAPLGAAYIKRDGEWTITVKQWPDDIDEWTHSWHSANQNPVAQDTEIGPPKHLQWVAKPRWQRHHDTVPSTSVMVSSHGRLFYIVDEAPPCLPGKNVDDWYLVARNAFNGVLLWSRPMKNWGAKAWSNRWLNRGNQPIELPKRLVAVEDTVYVTLGFDAPLKALDAATGETVRIYDGTRGVDEILYRDGRLILAVRQKLGEPGRDKPPLKKFVSAVDADTGRVLWKTDKAFTSMPGKTDSVRPFGEIQLTSGGDYVFLTTRDRLVCLDLETGEKVWHRPRPGVPRDFTSIFRTRAKHQCRLVYQDGVIILAQPEMEIRDPYQTTPGTLYAYAADDGARLWSRQFGYFSHVEYQPDLFVVDGLIWVHKYISGLEGRKKAGVPQSKNVGKHAMFPPKDKREYELLALGLKSGVVKRRFSTKRTFNIGHHHRCYSNRSTTEFVLVSRHGIEFLDLSSGTNWLNHWVRGTCLFGYLPANGLLYVPPHPCSCYIQTKLNGYYALAADQERSLDLPADSRDSPLEKGPAYGESSAEVDEADWPSFRRDGLRSGAASTVLPDRIAGSWKKDVGGRLTAPTIADGRLFVCIRDRHQVVALDVESGERQWTFTTGAEVDTPPTYHDGLLLFGSRDGFVYCLNPRDGSLAWKRRIAPMDRFVGAFGGIESAWPVHGSVLVEDGVAYAVAGRSSYLDGGIFLCALQPATGQVLEQKNIYSPSPKTGREPYGQGYTWSIPGALSDILVSDGGSVYMRRHKVFAGDGGTGNPVFSTAGMLDSSWFNRTRWSMKAVPGAQLLVFDGKQAYGIKAYSGTGRGGFFKPGDKGYRVFRTRIGSKTGKGWTRRIPVRGKAMLVAADKLVVAGAPDVLPENDPLAAFKGKRGAHLWILSTSDGEAVQKLHIDALPVWQGLAAADGCLYLADEEGIIHCFSSE